jgi:hypothetical protein
MHLLPHVGTDLDVDSIVNGTLRVLLCLYELFRNANMA